jgi:hypothetical protein
MTTERPTLWQYIGYSYGRRLPDSMKTWVFWLIPASFYVHLEMTAPIYIWTLLMALALNKVWRRFRLVQHDLDPNLVDVLKRRRDASMHEDYIRRFGPRPESAKWQSNSSPF